MNTLLQQIETHKTAIQSYTTKDAATVEQFRITYLGTKGMVKQLLTSLKDIPTEQKKEMGQLLNAFKQFVEEKYETLQSSIKKTTSSKIKSESIDWTLPGDDMHVGSKHPLSIIRHQIISIFNKLGFAVAEGPEIEDDSHNFMHSIFPKPILLKRYAGYFLYFTKS